MSNVRILTVVLVVFVLAICSFALSSCDKISNMKGTVSITIRDRGLPAMCTVGLKPIGDQKNKDELGEQTNQSGLINFTEVEPGEYELTVYTPSKKIPMGGKFTFKLNPGAVFSKELDLDFSTAQ